MDKKTYGEMASQITPPSPKIKNAVNAYIFGGGICVIGQAFNLLYTKLGFSKDNASLLVGVTLIVITAILTGIGVFDKIARYAGAGTIVPITGFANSMVSPAMEFKSEGNVLGTAANMFKIAGPVIVYGVVASSLYGLIYWICTIL